MGNARYSLLNNIRYICCHVRIFFDALHYLLDNIFVRFCSKLYRQNVVNPIGTYCALLVADLFWYERDLILSLSDNNQEDVVEAFNSTSRYLDGLLILIILISNK